MLIYGTGNVVTSEGLKVPVPSSLAFRDERNPMIIEERTNSRLKRSFSCPEARSQHACRSLVLVWHVFNYI